ncbi:DUF6233 domain-containing protein [Streptomyces sp. NPDC008121]|uniref:DUF6233 domain-containing protein n=1 Tax=Streptomyces sp. NPDC008121 TaxID=3364809 RepID=UPI0036EC9C32
MRTVRVLPSGPGWVLSYLRERGRPVADSAHIGDCKLAGPHLKPLNQDEARQAITVGGIRACEIWAGTTCTGSTATSATAVPPNTRPPRRPDHHTKSVRQNGTSSSPLRPRTCRRRTNPAVPPSPRRSGTPSARASRPRTVPGSGLRGGPRVPS